MKRILCALPDTNDSMAWWRGLGPLLALPDTHTDSFSFLKAREIEWTRIQQASAVFMSRPFLPEHAALLDMARTLNRPTWIDYDDNYWGVPESNYAYTFFDSSAQGILSRAASDAAVVTVSTAPLRDYIIERFNPGTEIAVVPNAFPDSYEWPTVDRKKIVLYRGGWKSHAADLFSVATELQRVMNDYPDWTFVFCGGHPIVVNGPNMKWAPMQSLPLFHAWLRLTGASIMINPLELSHFNACKSNIAWMEGTLAGAAVLCPRLPQYEEPGCELYSEGNFGPMLRHMLDMSDSDRSASVALSQETIDARYRLKHTNVIRAEIMAQL